GTLHRQGAASVTQIEILDRPPDERPADQPWPTMARIYKTTPAHDEGGDRRFSTETVAFLGETRVAAISVKDHTSDEVFRIPAQLILIAAGFVGPELDALELNYADAITPRGTLLVDNQWQVHSGRRQNLFACGDAVRGQSLIVWAIAEGRSAAASIDSFLTGSESELRAPIEPYALSW
ncbi:MAG: glutamate synthase, partial [Acidimicrobiales bacterium]